jgi:hypothetical protein
VRETLTLNKKQKINCSHWREKIIQSQFLFKSLNEVRFLQFDLSFHPGPVAQWITRLPTEQKIAGSIPARIVLIFFSVKLMKTKLFKII